MLYGRVFRRVADGLFAWTVLLRLRGDDGQREVVSQSWPVLPVLTGVNVLPSPCLQLSCMEMHMFNSCRECVCICVSLWQGGGIILRGRKPCSPLYIFCESVSAAAPQGHSALIQWIIVSAKFFSFTLKVIVFESRKAKEIRAPVLNFSVCSV